jgi:hypothetical protein
MMSQRRERSQIVFSNVVCITKLTGSTVIDEVKSFIAVTILPEMRSVQYYVRIMITFRYRFTLTCSPKVSAMRAEAGLRHIQKTQFL